MVIKKQKSELLALANVGPAVVGDLKLLGITSIEQLKDKNANDLFERLKKITGVTQNICVRDVFEAIIHEANMGQKVPWWVLAGVVKEWEISIKKKGIIDTLFLMLIVYLAAF